MFETDPHFLYPRRVITFVNGKLELASPVDDDMGNDDGSMLGGGGAWVISSNLRGVIQ